MRKFEKIEKIEKMTKIEKMKYIQFLNSCIQVFTLKLTTHFHLYVI